MSGDTAVIFGATGGIGAALVAAVRRSGQFDDVVALSRASLPPFDLMAEASIAAAAEHLRQSGRECRLMIDATGILSDEGHRPEKSLKSIDRDGMLHSFAVNAVGPALLMKHFLPLLPKHGRSVFATLSARVGSIADNELGGWYSYRAAKAALNQLVRTAAIEIRRSHRDAICLAVHPGTVDTKLSRGFAKSGLAVASPEEAAERIVASLSRAKTEMSGRFVDRDGAPIAW